MKKHKCRTYFRIIGNFDTKEVLNLINVEADKIYNKGEISEKSKIVREYDEITIGFNDKYDVNINVMIRKTLKDLTSKTELLASLKKELNLEYYLVLVPEIYTGSEMPNQILSLESDIIEFLYLTKTEQDLDYYIY